MSASFKALPPDNPPRSLDDHVPQATIHGRQWYKAGLCVACGKKVVLGAFFHCDECYTGLFPSIADYDDD